DLSTGHQHTAGVDDVLDPVDDLDVPVLVDFDQITGMEPAVVEGFGRGFGTIPVAFAQLWGAVEHLSLTVGPYVLTGCVDDSRLDEHHRSAGRTRVSVVLLRPQDGAQRAELRLTEAVVETELGQPRPQTVEDRAGHDRGAVVGLAQALEVPGLEFGAVGQGHPDGG